MDEGAVHPATTMDYQQEGGTPTIILSDERWRFSLTGESTLPYTGEVEEIGERRVKARFQGLWRQCGRLWQISIEEVHYGENFGSCYCVYAAFGHRRLDPRRVRRGSVHALGRR